MQISALSNLASSSFPAPTSTVTAVVLVADRVVPQPAGRTITWNAVPTGGEAPYEYKWLIFNGSDWDVAQNWSQSGTFRWKPAFANARYRVSVQVRSFGNSSDEFEASTEAAFAIDAAPIAPAPEPPALPHRHAAPAQPVSTVNLGVHPSSPQTPGTTITWTASATGGGSGRQFKWFVYDGSRWTTASAWSANEIFHWTPMTPNRRYRIAVWARSEGSRRDYFEACAEVGFAIEEPASDQSAIT